MYCTVDGIPAIRGPSESVTNTWGDEIGWIGRSTPHVLHVGYSQEHLDSGLISYSLITEAEWTILYAMLVYFVNHLHGYHDACGNNKRTNRQCAAVQVSAQHLDSSLIYCQFKLRQADEEQLVSPP